MREVISKLSANAASSAASVITILIGLTVMIGWHTKNAALVQIHPAFAPMQYNTALTFVFAGMALLSLALSMRRLATAWAAIAFALPFLTFIQYLLGVNFGIDTLFVEPFTTVRTSYPGRMSPVAAICYILIGAALLATGLSLRRFKTFFVFLSCLVVLSLSISAIIGYLIGIRTYGWGTLAQISVHAFLNNLILSAGLFSFALRDRKPEDIKANAAAPILTAVSLLVITLFFWQGLLGQQHDQIEESVETEAGVINRLFSSQINDRIEGLKRMASRRAVRPDMPKVEWEADANNYLSYYKGYQAIEWADVSMRVRWIAPFKGNEAAQDLDLAFEERRRTALEKARNNREIALTDAIELKQGGKGFLVFVPIFYGDDFGGFIVGVVRIQALFNIILRETDHNKYLISIFEENELLYQNMDSTQKGDESFNYNAALNLYGVTWKLNIRPTSDLIAKKSSLLPGAVLVFGSLTTILLALTIYLGQMALHGQEAKYRDLYDNAPDMFVSIEAATATIKECNQTLVTALGYTKQELLGHSVFDLYHPDCLEEVRKALHAFQTTGEVHDAELQLKHKDGGKIDVSLNVSCFRDKQGRILYSRSVWRDITERKQADAKIRKLNTELEQRVRERTAELESLAEQLERSNRELQDFASVAAHDLQEPLRKIRSFGDLLKEDCSETLSEDGRTFVEKMQTAAERMSELINDLLAFSRITAKAQPFVQSDLSRIAREALENLEELIKRTNGRVELGAMPVIDCDPSQMRQLLQNLIGNALKFRKKESAPAVKIYSESFDDSCRIVVKDDGIGFDQKHADRIFKMFQRLHGRNEYEGTGIGLAICRKIADRHKGDITAKSSPGQGAIFIVTLPVNQNKGENDA